MTSKRPGPSLRVLIQHTLQNDRIAQLMCVGVVLASLVALIPVIGLETKQTLFTAIIEPALLLILIAAALAGRKRLAHHEQRRFLLLIGGAFAAWLVSSIAGLTVPMDLTFSVLYPLQDSLLVVFYLNLFLASGTHPEWRTGWSRGSVGRRLEVSGTYVFLGALLVYFVLLPARAQPDEYLSLIPSYILVLLLDLGLVWRFGLLSTQSKSHQWRLVYGLLTASSALWLLADLAESLMELGVVPYVPQGHPLDIFWNLPWLTTVLAVRLQHRPLWRPHARRPDAILTEAQTGFSSLSAPLIVYALACPAIHLLLTRFDILDPDLESLREIVVLVSLLTLGVLALVQHRVLLSEARSMQAEIQDSERRLQETARLESIGKLAAGIAHDFNNLLLLILGHTTLAIEDLPEGSQARDRLVEVKRAADRTADLTNRLLAFSRRQPLDPKPVNLNELVDEVLQLTGRIVGEDIEMVTQLAPQIDRVSVDRGQFEQALVNMIVNARDAMPTGGRLTLRTAALDLIEVDHEDGTDYSGPGVELAIEDTGTGILPELQSRIFDPFFTTKEPGQGTGLGLATAYGTICQSGGDLRVESEPGRGTVFRILLPSA